MIDNMSKLSDTTLVIPIAQDQGPLPHPQRLAPGRKHVSGPNDETSRSRKRPSLDLGKLDHPPQKTIANTQQQWRKKINPKETPHDRSEEVNSIPSHAVIAPDSSSTRIPPHKSESKAVNQKLPEEPVIALLRDIPTQIEVSALHQRFKPP